MTDATGSSTTIIFPTCPGTRSNRYPTGGLKAQYPFITRDFIRFLVCSAFFCRWCCETLANRFSTSMLSESSPNSIEGEASFAPMPLMSVRN
ncbi:MAG: hypothetical protein NW701_17940 [Nitrospira sp.]